MVYLGGVTSISTLLRDPKDGPVVIAAENQGLLLNCLYGSCSTATEACLGRAPSSLKSDDFVDLNKKSGFWERKKADFHLKVMNAIS